MHYIVSAPPRRFSSLSVLSVVNVEFLSWHMSKNKPWASPGSPGEEADNGCRGSSTRFGSRSDADLRQTIQGTECWPARGWGSPQAAGNGHRCQVCVLMIFCPAFILLPPCSLFALFTVALQGSCMIQSVQLFSDECWESVSMNAL